MNRLNDYLSWSFTDRSFLFALVVSILWHLFWFFSVSIVVQSPKRTPHVQPKIVSLGPVLDDSIFRTLVETRPEISKAFYRQTDDFSAATEVPAETVEHYSPGDVVSVPFGKKFSDTLKERVSGAKISPDFALPELAPAAETGLFELNGVDKAHILTRPEAPPADLSPATPSVELEFSLDAQGNVTAVSTVVSSGDASADVAWEQYLSRWLFSPEGAIASQGARLRVRFRAPERAEA